MAKLEDQALININQGCSTLINIGHQYDRGFMCISGSSDNKYVFNEIIFVILNGCSLEERTSSLETVDALLILHGL